MLYPVELQARNIRAVLADSCREEPLHMQVFVQYLLQFGNSWYWALPAWIGLCDNKVTSVEPGFKKESIRHGHMYDRVGPVQSPVSLFFPKGREAGSDADLDQPDTHKQQTNLHAYRTGLASCWTLFRGNPGLSEVLCSKLA